MDRVFNAIYHYNEMFRLESLVSLLYNGIETEFLERFRNLNK